MFSLQLQTHPRLKAVVLFKLLGVGVCLIVLKLSKWWFLGSEQSSLASIKLPFL